MTAPDLTPEQRAALVEALREASHVGDRYYITREDAAEMVNALAPAVARMLADARAERDVTLLAAIRAIRDTAAEERVQADARGEALTDYSSGVLDGLDHAWRAARKVATRPKDDRETTSVEEWWACDDAYETGVEDGRAVGDRQGAARVTAAVEGLCNEAIRGDAHTWANVVTIRNLRAALAQAATPTDQP